MKYVKEILDQIGLNGQRLDMFNLSSAEGPRFAQIAAKMTERVRQLGPNPLRRDRSKDANLLTVGSALGGG